MGDYDVNRRNKVAAMFALLVFLAALVVLLWVMTAAATL